MVLCNFLCEHHYFMHVLLMLLLISFVIASVFLGLFWWCVSHGEFDDLEEASASLFTSSKKNKTPE